MPRKTPPKLFDLPPKTRAKRRVLMHVFDAGPGHGDKPHIARFRCKCGFESGWWGITKEEFRRGKPCPKCNKIQ